MVAKTVAEKYAVAEEKVDKALMHLAHIKYTAVVVAIAVLIDLWLIL